MVMAERIKKRRDGRYEMKYVVQTATGEKRRSVYGKTQAEVKEKLATAVADVQGRLVFEAEDVTVGEYLSAYVADAGHRVRPKTHRRYQDLSAIHILPALAGVKLEVLTPDHLRFLYRERLEAGYSPRTVGHAHTLVKQALSQATADGLIPRNVAASVKPPKSSGTEISPLTPGDVRRLFSEASGGRYEALYVVAVTAGLRRGELLGLKWEDLDLETRTLRVRRTLQKGELLAPKTPKSRRQISLTRRAVDSLVEHRERLDAERNGSWVENGFVFPNHMGKATDGDNLVGRHFKPLLRQAELPPIRFHDLRHTCATLLLGKGVHPKIVSEMLGHANISITLDTYSHVIPGMGDAAAGAMDEALK